MIKISSMGRIKNIRKTCFVKKNPKITIMPLLYHHYNKRTGKIYNYVISTKYNIISF
jgi:hypothetical protein